MSAVYLIRHAQASFGAEAYDELSELGFEQARVLGDALRGRVPVVGAVVTGSHRRHRQTAEACVAALAAAPAATTIPGFDELDHEETLVRLEPRYADRAALAADLAAHDEPRRAFQALFERAVARWTGGAHDAEYRETWPAFRARCAAALEEVIAGLAPSDTALVFTSGGPIAVIAARLLGVPDDRALAISWTLVNCGVTKVLHGPRGLRLSTLNEHAHFEGAGRRLVSYR